MDSIFAYTDYRKFLRDFYQDKKRLNPRFSLRMLAERCGFKARDYLLRVMNNQRNLSSEGAHGLSEYFGFSEKQGEYFHALVRFNQAATVSEKETFYRELAEIQKYGKHQKLRQDQFEYHMSWHHIALRSLLPLLGPAPDPEKTGRLLDPALTAKQVRDSMELLLRLGLLHCDGAGRYVAGDMALTTGDEVTALSVAGFHKATMDLAKQSIDRHPGSSRDISGLTMGISQDAYLKIKKEIQAFRKKIMALAMGDSGEDMIYQLNMHFFPLTKKRGHI